MERTPGLWAFQGVARATTVSAGEADFVRTEQGCVVKLWSCPGCKLVRVYADDTED